MKQYISLTIVAICLFSVTAKPAPSKYTTRYDSIDVDNVLSNDRLLNGYAKCLLNKGHCTPDGAELKRVLPDALKLECSKCSERQKVSSRKVLVYLIDNKPALWTDLEKLYDPTGDYKKKYCEIAKKEGTVVKSCSA